METIVFDTLYNYIQNNEVVYQFEDGLIEVSHGGKEDETVELLEFINKDSNVIQVSKAEMIDSNFVDIVEWSHENDVLYLVDDVLLINNGLKAIY